MIKTGDRVTFRRREPDKQVEVEGQEDYTFEPGKEFAVKGKIGDLRRFPIPVIEKDGHVSHHLCQDLVFGKKDSVSFKRTLPDHTKVDDEGNETMIPGKTITVKAKLGDLSTLNLPVIEDSGEKSFVEYRRLQEVK